ncbi:MAG: biotin/lipoyl-binding protein [Clostridia bacterium]|nr:biotin/lipoyl-binding protein [Clostridia bacterium]
MSIKSWSKRRKALLIIGIILSVAIVAGVFYMMFKPDPAPQVSVAEVTRGSITETLDVTGKVSPSKTGKFIPLDGAKVISVNVRVGDIVKKGDVLATFDISAINSLVAQKQQAYLTAAENYNNAVNTAVEASGQLKEIELRLEQIDKELAEAEKEADSKKEETAGDSSESQNDNSESTAMNKFWSLVAEALGMSDINASLEQLSSLLNSSSNLSGMFGSATSELEIEKMQLELKKVTLEAQSGNITQSTYKTIMEAAKTELDNLNASVASLKNGWIAENDGIVSEVNIKEGQVYRSANGAGSSIDLSTIINLASGSGDINALVSSLLGTAQSGITVEYHPFIASFVLNKYDVLDVKLDQVCRITAADESVVEGVVSYISPVASQSSGMDITSLMGSSTASGVDAQVTIDNPTSSIIIGLDVDISIDLDSKENVLLVPTEAIKSNKDGSYVYIYDPDTKKISFSKVEVGLSDNLHYEILSGCSEGDIIVTSTPTGITLTDGQKVAIKESK